jgi:hypothetical protein
MPRLSAFFIRFSLVYLLLGFTWGGLMLFNKGIPLHPLVWRLLPSHIEFVLFGWTVLLIMGMAFWILPRFTTRTSRGNEKFAWGALILVNAGIWLVALASVYPLYGWLVFMGRISQVGGVLLFILYAWPRIKGV